MPISIKKRNIPNRGKLYNYKNKKGNSELAILSIVISNEFNCFTNKICNVYINKKYYVFYTDILCFSCCIIQFFIQSFVNRLVLFNYFVKLIVYL
jgi:hypothetical protein